MRNLLLLFIFAVMSCAQKKAIVSVNECHESLCTRMQLYQDGTFDLAWTFPSGSVSYQYNSPPELYQGQFLVKGDRVLLYTDSTFDSSGESKKLDRFQAAVRIPFE